MSLGFAIGRRLATASRAVALVLLAGALLAPKVSLALATAFGNGYTSVVICTGTGLARVTVSAEGEIVDDVSETWVSPHCVLPDDGVALLERAWRRADYPRFALVGVVPPTVTTLPPRLARPAASSRGPPTA